MKILVTGGTGVIGAGAIPELISAGWTVRLLCRGAAKGARDYAEGVEPFSADISDAASLDTAMNGCEVVLHIAGIVQESPPEVTFQKVNVEGTRNIMDAADRTGVRRFVFMSSLGADSGRSAYHQSKRAAELIVESFSGEWVILRSGNVYGPGDEVISSLLKMIRTLPVVPIIDGGKQRFQPIWFQDLGRAVRQAVSDPGANRRILEVAGNEITTTDELVNRLREITGRDTAKLNLGPAIASAAAAVLESAPGQKVMEKTGLSVPISSSKLQMLEEENLVRSEEGNAMGTVFGIETTPLDEGLRMLADELPELLPSEGVGALERKRFWAEFPSDSSPADLMRLFRENLTEVMPIDFQTEPNTPLSTEEGSTLTAAIPGRGNIQVRVEESTDERLTLATVEGHFLAGIVTFFAQDAGEGRARFNVEIFSRAANLFDWLAMRTVGRPLQNQNWTAVVEAFGDLASGQSVEVQSESVRLGDAEAKQVERWIEKIVQRRKQIQNAQQVNG